MTSGGAIHDAGALGALIAYAVIGAMVFFLMTSLGEMATYLPCQVHLVLMLHALSILH